MAAVANALKYIVLQGQVIAGKAGSKERQEVEAGGVIHLLEEKAESLVNAGIIRLAKVVDEAADATIAAADAAGKVAAAVGDKAAAAKAAATGAAGK